MPENTNDIRRKTGADHAIDAIDRKLLGLMSEDATRTYAEMGRLLHLSPPAVHERVKKLRRNEVIRKTSVSLDGKKIGKPLLAFVHVDTTGWGKNEQTMALRDFPEVEEIHSVAGDACLMLKVRTSDARALEALLEHVYKIDGVKGTRSYVVLNTYLERGVQPDETAEIVAIAD